MLNKFFHWLSHRTNTYSGKVVTWQDDEYTYIGFECSYCKQIDQSLVDKLESEKIYGKDDFDSGVDER
jgi:hypothetical protein